MVKQFQARVENARRTSTPKIKKRVHVTDECDTEEVTPEKRAAVQDIYGCVNWEVKFMPLSETAESQQLKKRKDEESVANTGLERRRSKGSHEVYILQSTKKRYQKKIRYHIWPFLFQESGVDVHFKDLTGIPLKETLTEK